MSHTVNDYTFQVGDPEPLNSVFFVVTHSLLLRERGGAGESVLLLGSQIQSSVVIGQ